MQHICRAVRVLSLKSAGGHALLVGVGGSGRQSLARLAAFIVDCAVVQPEVTAPKTLKPLT